MDQLTFDFFILKKEVTDLDRLRNIPEEYCLDLGADLLPLKDFVNDEHIDDGIISLDGGVIISYHYKPLTDVTHWDDLPTLLAYTLNLIEDYIKNGQSSFYYPGQPIKVELQKEGHLAKLSVDDRSILVNSDLLIDRILYTNERFFGFLVREMELNKYQYELEQIKSIRNADN